MVLRYGSLANQYTGKQLKHLSMLNWDSTMMEKDALALATSQVFEKLRGQDIAIDRTIIFCC